jgi:AcrR family transcriptional regulator
LDGTLEALKPAQDEEPGRRGRIAAGQDPAKREQILAGARRVFTTMGFDAASMNDITREAGVSKGTIYVYFDDKEDLFQALVEFECSTMFAGIFDSLERPGATADLRGTLLTYGMGLARKVTSSIVVRAQRIVIGVSERKPALGARFYENGPLRSHDRLVEFFDRAIAAGKLSIPDPDLAAYQFADLCVATLSRQILFGYRTAEPADAVIEPVVASAVDMFLKAYSVAKADI